MTINIVPVPCFNGPATTLQVDDGRVNLGFGADFQYTLLNQSGQVVFGPGREALTSDQYAAWTGDDLQVITDLAANLGLVVATVTAPTTVTAPVSVTSVAPVLDAAPAVSVAPAPAAGAAVPVAPTAASDATTP